MHIQMKGQNFLERNNISGGMADSVSSEDSHRGNQHTHRAQTSGINRCKWEKGRESEEGQGRMRDRMEEDSLLEG